MGQGNKSRRKGGSGSHGHTGTKRNRGPRHGHGNRGKGGGNAYGTNNVNMTIGQAKKIYANQLAEGISLQDAMRHNKAETVRFSDLLDDQGDTKQSNSNTSNTLNNTMTLTAKQTKLNELYQKNFGRDAGYGAKGGADYWIDTHAQGDNVDWNKIDAMLAGSDEGQKHAGKVKDYNKGQVYVGGIDSTKAISSQSGWADHFKKGGVFENQNAAGAAQAIADQIGFTPQEAYFNNSVGGGGDNNNNNNNNNGNTKLPADGWWNQFADADAFKKFLQGDQQDNGMGDFMKFMMLMSVMGGGRGMGGGGGYGGSQYGYGGLNPGGVQAAYDPMQHLQGMGTWFKDNFGSSGGSSATTSTVNT